MRRLFLPLSALPLVACNLLVGGDDLVFRDGAGGGASSSTAASVGSALTTASGASDSSASSSGGVGGESGAGGDGGAGSTGGTGGDGGAGGGCDGCTPVSALALGGSTCAILGEGRVRCWGPNDRGQLGIVSTADVGQEGRPLLDVGLAEGAVVEQIDVGKQHACAVFSTGQATCWGRGDAGQLGDGSEDDIGDNEVVSTVGTLATSFGVLKIAAGEAHTCALLGNGQVTCWGSGADGRLGYASIESIRNPDLSVALSATAVDIAAGAEHTCVVLDGAERVQCWGKGTEGRLGRGDIESVGDNETPGATGFLSFDETILQIVAGDAHTCVLLESSEVVCWGRALANGSPDELGSSELVGEGTPRVVVAAEAEQIVDLAAGADHTCVVLDDGAVRCWGEGDEGRLGYGDEVDVGASSEPIDAGDVDVGGVAVRVAAGDRHTCVLLANGTVRCWGDGLRGQLGYGASEIVGDDDLPSEHGPVDL